jgi:hypothetical protein
MCDFDRERAGDARDRLFIIVVSDANEGSIRFAFIGRLIEEPYVELVFPHFTAFVGEHLQPTTDYQKRRGSGSQARRA